MDLNSILVSEFAKITNDNKETINEGATVYGTYRVDGDGAYVQIDGSDTRTPVATTTGAKSGDRVTVLIKNHRAIVTGNLTDPSATTETVENIEKKLDLGLGSIDDVIKDVNDIGKIVDPVSWKYTDSEGNIQTLSGKIGDITSQVTGMAASIEGAAKVATNFIEFVKPYGLIIGDLTGSKLGFNTLIDATSLNMRYNDTVLAKYTADSIYLGHNSIKSKISMCANRFNITAGGAFELDPNNSTETILESTDTCLTLQNGTTWIGILNNSTTSPFGGNIYVSGVMEVGGIICNDIVDYEGHEYITYLKGYNYYADINHEHSGYYKSGSNINVREIKSSYTYGDTVDYSTNMYIGTSGILHRTTKTSSRTVKHDIKPIENSDILPEKLYDVDVIQFVYNEGQLGHSSKRYGKELPGFIVEDLVEKYPIAVDIDEEDKPFQWNEQYLIPPMLALIQQQKKKLDELESRIEAFEKKEV